MRIPVATIGGAIPEALHGGVLFKNGPARFSRGDEPYAHWLDGDGYVTALRFDMQGSASWSAAFVKTEAFVEEEMAGRVRYRTTFGTQKQGGVLSNALDIRLKSPANTNVLCFDGGLLALWEAGPPYALDAETLACVGASSLRGRIAVSRTHGALPGTTGLPAVDGILDALGLLCDAVSAHPRRDAAAHSTVAWTWRQELLGDAIEVRLHTLHDAGSMADDRSGSWPPAAVCGRLSRVSFAPHDMALSARHACFLTAPTTVSILPFIAGLRGPAQCTTFDAARIARGEGSVVHLLRRDGSGTVTCALGDPFHAVHHANAWDDDSGHVHLVSSCWPPHEVHALARSGRDLLGSWRELEAGDFSGVPTTNLCHFVVDPESSELVMEPQILAGAAQLDHPKTHPHFEARQARYVIATCGARGHPDGTAAVPVPTQSFVIVDLEGVGGPIVDCWHAGERRIVDEATLVPKYKECDERDAWLVAPVFDGATRMTSYVVLDCADLAAGPVCELPLPTHIPWGLHGAWLGHGERGAAL